MCITSSIQIRISQVFAFALIVIFAVLGIGLCPHGSASPREAGPGYPKIFFRYTPVFDSSFCGPSASELFAARESIMKNPQSLINRISLWYSTPAQTEEAVTRLPEFQNYWDMVAPELLGTVVSQIGSGFSRKEYTATLMLCRTKLSLGSTILMTYWPFLKSTAPGGPAPHSAFASLFFHELLHSYVDERIDPNKPTPLLVRFEAEPLLTRVHLHLMAIQKMVYLKLGQKDILDARIRSDSILPDYARAWEIVNRVEPGFQAFVDELKAK